MITEHTNETLAQQERGPIRTCVGCRTRAPKEALVRLTLPDLVVDLAGRSPGRGVHLHPSRACVAGAFKRGGLAQAMRRAPTTTPDALRGAIGARYVERVAVLLGTAQRAGQLAIGQDAVREAMSSVALMVLASDAQDEAAPVPPKARVAKKSWDEAGLSFGSKGALGRMFGRDEVAVLGVLDAGIADHVAHAMDVASEMTEAR